MFREIKHEKARNLSIAITRSFYYLVVPWFF